MLVSPVSARGRGEGRCGPRSTRTAHTNTTRVPRLRTQRRGARALAYAHRKRQPAHAAAALTAKRKNTDYFFIRRLFRLLKSEKENRRGAVVHTVVVTQTLSGDDPACNEPRRVRTVCVCVCVCGRVDAETARARPLLAVGPGSRSTGRSGVAARGRSVAKTHKHNSTRARRPVVVCALSPNARGRGFRTLGPQARRNRPAAGGVIHAGPTTTGKSSARGPRH